MRDELIHEYFRFCLDSLENLEDPHLSGLKPQIKEFSVELRVKGVPAIEALKIFILKKQSIRSSRLCHFVSYIELREKRTVPGYPHD